MTQHLTEAAVVGILALIIIREVFQFVVKIRGAKDSNGGGRRQTSEKVKAVQDGVDAVLARLDRIIERLEDLSDATRDTRKQSQLTAEKTERLCRQVDLLDRTITDAMAAHRRKTDTQPTIQP